MQLRIDFGDPIIPKEDVLKLQPADLNDFYADASDFDKGNLFFVLLTSLHFYEEQGLKLLAAHLNYLAAYYLFVTLTPPGSCHLALYYIKKALELNPLPEYEEWLNLIKKGN